MKNSFKGYKIISNMLVTKDTFIMRLKQKNMPQISFQAGQYCKIKNPTYSNPNEIHCFSFASSSANSKYVELCIKKYGPWSQAFSTLVTGDTIELAGPYGNTVLHESLKSVVFLVGGVGIAPVMSILRTIFETNPKITITLLYGARTPEDVVYKEEIENIIKNTNASKVSYIYSNLSLDYPWLGHRGFITEEILTKEVKFNENPVFYLFGPPIFIGKMDTILTKLNVAQFQIYKEVH